MNTNTISNYMIISKCLTYVIHNNRNFKEFRAEQILDFFKASELVEMKQGDIIFSPEDNEKYFYSVVKGEIHLVCLDIGNRELEELIKVAGPDECIVSLLSFLHHLAVSNFSLIFGILTIKVYQIMFK